MRKQTSKKALYESIMNKVSKVVKKSLNESIDVRGVEVSHGTMRPYDIIKAEIDFLFHNFKDEYRRFFRTADFDFEFPLALDDENHPYWDNNTDDVDYVMEELNNILNDLAPEGYYYGANMGDGSSLGFWNEDETVVLESRKSLKRTNKRRALNEGRAPRRLMKQSEANAKFSEAMEKNIDYIIQSTRIRDFVKNEVSRYMRSTAEDIQSESKDANYKGYIQFDENGGITNNYLSWVDDWYE